MDKETLIRRLSIIKLLYKIGIEQSFQNEMVAFFSILSFHDSVEMFLKLATEIKGKSDCQRFMEYWEQLPDLTLKETMRNLNARRVNLKHKGLIPTKIEIETSRVNTTDFFAENTPIIFGLNFSDISLFDLMQFEVPRHLLITSQNALDQNKIEICIEEVTKAFYELLHVYKHSKRNWKNKTHFDLVEKINYPNSVFSRVSNNNDQILEHLFEKVNQNFENIQSALEVVSLGLNYRKYIKFKILTPVARRLSTWKYVLQLVGDKNWSKENCQFLIDFVLESSLKLQQFDFEFDSLDLTKFEITIKGSS